MAWAGLRADAQRTCPSLLLDGHVLRGECWRTKVSRSGQPFGLAFGFSGRPPRGWGHVYFNALRKWHSQIDLEGQNLVIDDLVSHMVYYNERPVVATPMRFSTATTFLRAFQAPQMQNARMTPEKARQCTLHSLKATMLSIAEQVDVPEHHRAEQGHHRQHGGRASVRLYSRDDVWRALACQQLVVQRVAEGFRPLTAQGRGAQIPLAEPTVEIDPFTIPMEVIPNDFYSSPISQTKATEVPVATFRGPRRSSKLQTLLPTPGNMEEPTDSSVTSSESSTPEENPPPLATNAWKNFVRDERPHIHVAVAAPAGADNPRSMEYDKKRLQTACRCPPQAASDMLHEPAAAATLAHSLPDQSLSGCDPGRAGSSEVYPKFG